MKQELASICQAFPGGVVCLLSALNFHGFEPGEKTRDSDEIWLAVERGSDRPEPGGGVRIVRFSGSTFRDGIEEHEAEGGKVRVYCLAKTIADCFKFRTKIGMEVGIEALQVCHAKGLCSLEDVWRYAKQGRVVWVMRPYLDALG